MCTKSKYYHLLDRMVGKDVPDLNKAFGSRQSGLVLLYWVMSNEMDAVRFLIKSRETFVFTGFRRHTSYQWNQRNQSKCCTTSKWKV